MRAIKLFIFSVVILHSSIVTKAQEGMFERIKAIKVMSSTRQDVERLFGKPNDELPLIAEDREIISWYIYENESVEITYSNGKCEDGWLAPKDTVISISLNFKEDRKLSELNRILKRQKIKLNKLRAEENYHGVKDHFYDDKNGISYVVNTDSKIWGSIHYYPSTKYSQFRCED